MFMLEEVSAKKSFSFENFQLWDFACMESLIHKKFHLSHGLVGENFLLKGVLKHTYFVRENQKRL